MSNNFLFSRRFWIPFLLVLTAHLWWFGRELGNLYVDDFRGKGLPSGLFLQWLCTMLHGPIFYVSFLAAFVTGITWFSHFHTKHRQSSFHPFTSGALITLICITGLAFVYMAYTAPDINKKGKKMMTEIVLSRSYEEYKTGMKRTDANIDNSERSQTLTELFARKRYLNHRNIDEFDKTGERYPIENSLKMVRFEIGKRFAVPVVVILFYICGIFMGFSFYKTYRLIPFFLSWLLVALGWFVLDSVLMTLYKRENVGLFIGAWGASLAMAFVVSVWYWALRRYGFFKRNVEGLPADFLEQ